MPPAENVLRALAKIESADRIDALRFEPLVYAKRDSHPSHVIDAIVKANRCSRHTAAVIYSTSFGCWQLMGFNLYASWNAPHVSVGFFLSSRENQRNAIRRFLERNGLDRYTQEQLLTKEHSEAFAKKYNGPGNVIEYGSRLRNALAQMV